MDNARTTAFSFAEKIAALTLLHKHPNIITPPSDNPDTPYRRQRPGYTLQFDEERVLASTLAFLAPRNDKSNDITALCVQEDHERSGLNILVAINKANPSDGNITLSRLRKDFEVIFSMLAQVGGEL